MLKIRKNKIYLTRGDSLFLEVDISDESGEEYEPKDNDKIIFRLKKCAMSKKILIEKEISTSKPFTLILEPEDTENLDFSIYAYEIEVISSGLHFTIIENEIFEIGKELENHE